MSKIQRDDIHIISRHSNWSQDGITKELQNEVYNDKQSWEKFLRLFFISLGIGFTTAGIIFFFAYNWADLHKFAKIGLIEALIIITTSIVLFSKASADIKNILLTGTSMLVGVLFAVFGQIYQTGANAYDFFLGWTMAIALWALISNFAPLWLVFITLVNTTFILYDQQVAHEWSELFVLTMLFLINAIFLIIVLLSKRFLTNTSPPSWFTNLIGLVTITCSTIGICFIIFERSEQIWDWVLPLLTVALYTLGIIYGLKNKRSFYLSVIPFSIIIIISAMLIRIFNDEAMLFVLTLFIIGSVTLVIINLINLQKKWKN